MKRAFNRIGRVFEAIGRRPADAIETSRNDTFRDFRKQVCVGVLAIGGTLGVGLLFYYPSYPKQLVISLFGLASLVAAIAGIRARTRAESIRRTWWALGLFTIAIGLMVLVENFWPPLFPSICYDSC